MSDSDEPKNESTETTQISNTAEIAAQLIELLRLGFSQPPKTPPQQPTQSTVQPESLGEIHLSAKLDGDNYSFWENLMERAIGGNGLTSHISGVSSPLSTDDPNFPRWQQRDHCCFNWIINNIGANLMSEVSQYATAQDLWEGLAITYGSGADPFQVSDLHRQAYGMKQGNMSLEALWTKFQDLWISIDAKDPNPMDTPSTIEKYNRNTQRHRLYQLLWALDEKYDTVKRELLNKDPLPTVREAYGIIRRESANEKVMKTSEPKESGVGIGLGAFDRHRPAINPPHRPPANRKGDDDKNKLSCSHCGGKKHTRETCFLIHGYPEWWEEMKKARQQRSRGGGRASMATAVGDRATHVEFTTGSNGTPNPNNVRDEDKALATVARVWSSGTEATGGEAARAESSEKAAAQNGETRVWAKGKGGFDLNPSNILDSNILPHFINNPNPTPKHDYLLPYGPSSSVICLEEPQILKINSSIPCHNSFKALANSSTSEIGERDHDWIFDCGATDTMSFDRSDFFNITESIKSFVQTANGELASVQGVWHH